MSQPNKFPEPLVDELRKVLQQREYLYRTTTYISVRRRKGQTGSERLYTVGVSGEVSCWGPDENAVYGWKQLKSKATYFYKFPTVHEALKFVQTGVVLKLYGDNVPEYFTRR
jgi:hypothetical protein